MIPIIPINLTSIFVLKYYRIKSIPILSHYKYYRIQKMNYIKFTVKTVEANREILIAMFSQHPFDAFEETDMGFYAYIPTSEMTPDIETALEDFRQRFPYEALRETIVPQNWNQVWEASFHPIVIGDFCAVRASFHQVMAGVAHEIVIDPKMAFGTGHHETTYMVINAMKDLDFVGKKVLDYGCGTGILAILGEKLGATQLDALDIDPAATENATENTKLNNSKHINIHQGTLNTISQKDYDIILANINRNVIIQSLPALHSQLKTGGKLIISGILTKDRALVEGHINECGFKIQEVTSRGGWVCITVSSQ